MENPIEIYVNKVVKDADGNTVVIATGNNRVNIREGDCFFYCYEVDMGDVLKHVPEPRKFNIQTVYLKVTKIDLGRGRFVSEVPIGHTAGLYLSGEGLDCVKEGKLLRTED